MMFLCNSILLFTTTSFMARHVMAQSLRAFDNNVNHRALQTTPPAITAVNVFQPSPSGVVATDLIRTRFFHIDQGSNSVERSYLKAGCSGPLTLVGTAATATTAAIDYETVLYNAPPVSPSPLYRSTVTNKISQIYDEMALPANGGIAQFVPTVADPLPFGATRGEQFTYCVRLTYKTPDNDIVDFKEIDITYRAFFDENNVLLDSTVSGESNSPETGIVNSELLTVSAVACDVNGAQMSPLTISEGNDQRFCVRADQYPTTGMVSIDSFFFAGTPQDNTVPVTQNAITTGGPSNVLTTVESCTPGAQFCGFTTILKGQFYQKPDGSRVDATSPTVITGSGTATIRIGGAVRKARLLLMLRSGDEVVKKTTKVEFMAAPKDEKKDCDCSGTFFLFKIFCLIFKCLLGF